MINLHGDILGGIVIRTLVVYVALLLGLRVAGKRELGQMSPFDLVVVLVLANAVQNAMVGPDTSLTGGLVAAGTLLAVNWGVDQLRLRYGWFARGIRGSATLLVNDGHFIEEHLRHEGIDEEDVHMAMREHGVDELSQVKAAILEVDGTISIVPGSSVVHRTRRRARGHKPTG
ncbi:MAG: YetF domain-containing protein [Nitrolancea sp.]